MKWLIVFALLVSVAGAEEIHMWTDENGVTHITNRPVGEEVNAETMQYSYDEEEMIRKQMMREHQEQQLEAERRNLIEEREENRRAAENKAARDKSRREAEERRRQLLEEKRERLEENRRYYQDKYNRAVSLNKKEEYRIELEKIDERLRRIREELSR